MTNISDEELEKKTIEILGKNMSYVERGEGNPIIFHPDSIEIVKDHLRKNILK